MVKRFGGWNLDTPREKREKHEELETNKRNGPVIISNINDKTDEQTSTHEEKTTFSNFEKTLPIEQKNSGESEHLPG
jgi:hypothetical protein